MELSQQEVAFLLGTESGAKVCRYERFVREPGLETALAYEIILRKPIGELFGGLYKKIEHQVITRAKTLARRAARRKANRRNARKQQALNDLANRKAKPKNS